MFLLGGGKASVEEYLAPEQRWVSVPDMPSAAHQMAAVAFDGNLLVIGGADTATYDSVSAVFEYNLMACSWKELPSLLTARYDCALTVLGGDVVVMGGRCGAHGHGDTPLSSVERYNRRLQCWEAMPSLTDSLVGIPSAVVVRG